MVEALRPMSTGELLDRTFALYRKNFPLFFGIAVVTHTVYLAYALLTVRSAIPHAGRLGTYYLHLGLNWSVATLVLTISHAATVKAVAAVHLDQPTSVWTAYRTIRTRMVSVFGVLVYVFLIAGLIAAVLGFVALMILGLILVAAGSPKSAPATVGLGIAMFAGGFATFVAVYVRYALAIQACVVENLTAWASMKRSVFLSKGGRLRIAAVYVVFAVFSWIAAVTLAWLARAAGIPLHNRIVTLILADLAGFASGSLTSPLATIGISLLYYDERVRKEAFDLQLMLASLDTSYPAGVAAAVQI
jgi:hypothetical protein